MTLRPNLTESGDNSTTTLFVGVLPSWQPEPTANLFSVGGWPWPDGTDTLTSHTAWFPTFHPPADDSRVMYVVVVTGDARTRLLASPHTIVFFDDVGDAFWPECGRYTGHSTANTAGTCAEQLGLSEAELWQAGSLHLKFDWKLRNPDALSTPKATLGDGLATPTGPTPTSSPAFDWQEGLFQDPENPGSGSNIIAKSLWVGTFDGIQYAVYTGTACAENMADGKVWVWPNVHPVTGWADVLAGAGALRITSVKDGVVAMTDEHGAPHRYDIAQHAWLP